VVELLLRIPAYLHFESGRERGLARRAFASDVPSPILNRLWKDRVPGLAETLMERHMAVLRETLLDGVLMRKSLLNRQATEAALSTRSGKNSVLTGEIMQLLDLELWARNWESIPSLSADRRHPEPLVLSS
jgi:asparagine synthase (glutamine-hydrolysing)